MTEAQERQFQERLKSDPRMIAEVIRTMDMTDEEFLRNTPAVDAIMKEVAAEVAPGVSLTFQGKPI